MFMNEGLIMMIIADELFQYYIHRIFIEAIWYSKADVVKAILSIIRVDVDAITDSF